MTTVMCNVPWLWVQISSCLAREVYTGSIVPLLHMVPPKTKHGYSYAVSLTGISSVGLIPVGPIREQVLTMGICICVPLSDWQGRFFSLQFMLQRAVSLICQPVVSQMANQTTSLSATAQKIIKISQSSSREELAYLWAMIWCLPIERRNHIGSWVICGGCWFYTDGFP